MLLSELKNKREKKSLTICHLTLVKLIRLRELKSFYSIVMYNDLLLEYMKKSRRREGRQTVFFKLNDHAVHGVLINQYHFIENMSKRQKRFIFHAQSLSRLSFQGRNEY